ncbi:MAG: TetR/AcrR family transcriptional regulator [Candidatus Hodarchaeales archaeon]|jgi:AcrR family transcriptional regulator
MIDKKKSVKKKQKLRTKKKEKTRKEILQTAHKFFTENPFHEVTMEDIADTVFVSRTTIYNYFKNKYEVFFGIGKQIFEEANKNIETNFPSDLPGNEQVIMLCQRGFKASFEGHIIYAIIKEFYNRVNARNLSLKEIDVEVAKSLGTNNQKKVVEKFDEPYLIEFYKELLKNENLWIRAVRNGRKDDTIKNDLPDEQIVHFLYILMSGIVNELELEKTTLERIDMTRETVINQSLSLISTFLKGS